MNKILSADNIVLKHHDRTVLDHISLAIHEKEIVTVIGPNGCGKSTLMKVLLGLIDADSGKVWQQKNLRIGYVPQKLQLDERMPLTVLDFLKLVPKTKLQTIESWLDRLSIQRLAQQPVQKLSGGEWQRVLLVRALLTRPDILVLDEPVQGVDVQGQMELYTLLPQLRDELGCAILMVSHDLHLVMAATDNVICLNGHVCCSGHPDDVAIDPAFNHLFGEAQRTGVTPPIAHYTHHHDHKHHSDGHIESTGSCCGADSKEKDKRQEQQS